MTQTTPNAEIRVLIADDEPLARRGLQQVLRLHTECQIVAEARNGREALRALRALQPDVVFLDIQMPGLDGFQVLQLMTGERMPIIVFVTAFDEFAVRAFEAHALDYLLKPVTQERFDQAMQRVRERLRADQAVELSRRFLAFLSGEEPAPRAQAQVASAHIVVPTATGDLVLNPEELDWIEADDYYAVIHALGQRHLIRESLTSLEQRLDPAQFVRVHRSAIVRLDRVRELRSAEPGPTRVILRDGTQVPVSRRRREQVGARIRRK
ncbi:MAG: LytR/AlgR family response regulator transcription factor [Longimicrobiales bacterium]